MHARLGFALALIIVGLGCPGNEKDEEAANYGDCVWKDGNPGMCPVCIEDATCNAPTYTDNQDGTVGSSCCGLTWQQEDGGSDGPNGLGYEWDAAKGYCSTLALDGGGWRLPTIAELASLVQQRSGTLHIDIGAFPNTQSIGYWSATPYADDEVVGAWFAVFSSGHTLYTVPSTQFRARCVRSGAINSGTAGTSAAGMGAAVGGAAGTGTAPTCFPEGESLCTFDGNGSAGGCCDGMTCVQTDRVSTGGYCAPNDSFGPRCAAVAGSEWHCVAGGSCCQASGFDNVYCTPAGVACGACLQPVSPCDPANAAACCSGVCDYSGGGSTTTCTFGSMF